MKGGVNWESKGEMVVVRYYEEEVLPREAAMHLKEALRLIGLLQGEQPMHHQEAAPPKVPVPRTNRSFGKLPPGSRPRWLFKEWVHFSLWVLAVGTLLVAALWKNLLF
jgi:hypothetical protein